MARKTARPILSRSSRIEKKKNMLLRSIQIKSAIRHKKYYSSSCMTYKRQQDYLIVTNQNERASLTNSLQYRKQNPFWSECIVVCSWPYFFFFPVYSPSRFSSTSPVPGTLQNSTTNSKSSLNGFTWCSIVGSITPTEVGSNT